MIYQLAVGLKLESFPFLKGLDTDMIWLDVLGTNGDSETMTKKRE